VRRLYSSHSVIIFLRNIVHVYTCIIIHLYEYMYIYPTSISTFKRLSRIDLEINEVGRQERLAVDGDVDSH
jgi:hypothetical protein